MRIGVPREIKNLEYRVGMTPAGAAALVHAGHEVVVQRDAGAGSGFSDVEYETAGARIAEPADAWNADLVVKVKEPLESEYGYLRGQIVFTYFHLAGVTAGLTDRLLESGTTAVAYETVEDREGRLPLLAPMSAVAGNMAITIGNYYLAKFNNGRGMLLGRVLGRQYGRVLVIGDGVVGRHAARTAAATGARVTIAGRHSDRIGPLREEISPELEFVRSESGEIAAHVPEYDLVVGAVLVRGAKAPYVVTGKMVATMQRGSVIVDVSIDQGGCVETSRPTTHSDPVFTAHGVTHYCVTNMPGAYPRTSTIALTSATLPFALRIAGEGMAALRNDPGFGRGVNTFRGQITCRAVAEALDRMKDFSELRID